MNPSDDTDSGGDGQPPSEAVSSTSASSWSGALLNSLVPPSVESKLNSAAASIQQAQVDATQVRDDVQLLVNHTIAISTILAIAVVGYIVTNSKS